MGKEFPLQSSLFSEKLVDTRTRKQRQRDQALQEPQQVEMFSQREMGQFGVNAHPRLPISPKTRLELVMQDLRTEEEKVRQFQQEIEAHTYPMFGGDLAHPAETEGTA
ncbi:MAG: hypothetical protein KJ069_25995 [Anaerolineae bacterium]|nr:hypothetical protein [Anaerolineae bacterium]